MIANLLQLYQEQACSPPHNQQLSNIHKTLEKVRWA
jgi:hypothetical protein